ncbi:hypothetical protein LX36DRAFT_662608 [Colletotrichum falcatum]|nr:hypothetical protein LX36DRAFT_662608 [Colletotrichum falcatum]
MEERRGRGGQRWFSVVYLDSVTKGDVFQVLINGAAMVSFACDVLLFAGADVRAGARAGAAQINMPLGWF